MTDFDAFKRYLSNDNLPADLLLIFSPGIAMLPFRFALCAIFAGHL